MIPKRLKFLTKHENVVRQQLFFGSELLCKSSARNEIQGFEARVAMSWLFQKAHLGYEGLSDSIETIGLMKGTYTKPWKKVSIAFWEKECQPEQKKTTIHIAC